VFSTRRAPRQLAAAVQQAVLFLAFDALLHLVRAFVSVHLRALVVARVCAFLTRFVHVVLIYTYHTYTFTCMHTVVVFSTRFRAYLVFCLLPAPSRFLLSYDLYFWNFSLVSLYVLLLLCFDYF
jgi:hypothetical protein